MHFLNYKNFFTNLLIASYFVGIIVQPSAFAIQDSNIDEKSISDTEVRHLEKQKKSTWDKFKEQLDNAKLSFSLSVPTLELADGLEINGDGQIRSAPGIGGKYSGVDIWKIGVTAYSQLLGLEDLPIDISAGASREVTYIQQFNSRKDSILRVPYDPISKIPLKADHFDKKWKNLATGEEELVFKVGDFIAYRGPLSLGLGKSLLDSSLIKNLDLSLSYNYVVSGEFDIHIFRMSEDLVRVKIFAIKDKSHNRNINLTLFGLDGIGEIVVKKILDIDVLRLFSSDTRSDLFLADFVFNITSNTSRDLYNQLIGHKMKLLTQDGLTSQIKHANPFSDKVQRRDQLIADLESINKVAYEDLNKPYNQRRVIRVIAANNITEFDKSGINFSLLRFVRLNSNTVSSEGNVAIINDKSSDSKSVDRYLLNSVTKSSSYELFWLWGEKNSVTTSLLIKNNSKGQATEFVGLQNSHQKDDMSLSKSEYTKLKLTLNKLLPKPVADKLTFPDWDFSNGKIKNVYVRQDVYFTKELFGINVDLKSDYIRNKLKELLSKMNRVQSYPTGANPANYLSNSKRSLHNLTNDKIHLHRLGRYTEAFADDIETITSALKIIFNSKYSSEERYRTYAKLLEDVSVFAEINGLILLNLIPENELANCVVAKLAISGRNVDGAIMEFPNKESYNQTTLFRNILSQNNYILDRSYNLRIYLNEKGEPFRLDEILKQ